VPTETDVTLIPDTAQTPGVADEKLTVSPDEAGRGSDTVTGGG